MTDQDRLKDKLTKMAAWPSEVGPGGRVLATGDRAGVLAALLHEIDETILGRKLTIQNDNGVSFEIEVANRRILALVKLSDHDILGPHTGLLDTTNYESGSIQVAGLAGLVNDFVADAGSISVAVSRLDRTTEAGEIGCTAEKLGYALGISLYGATIDDTTEYLDSFRGYCQDISLAWLRFNNDGEPESFGDADKIEKLRQFAYGQNTSRIQKLDRIAKDDNAPSCVVLGPAGGNAESVIFIEAGPDRLYGVIPDRELPEVLKNWHQQR